MLTIADLIAVLSLCLTSFGLGYAIGSNSNKTTLILCQTHILLEIGNPSYQSVIRITDFQSKYNL